MTTTHDDQSDLPIQPIHRDGECIQSLRNFNGYASGALDELENAIRHAHDEGAQRLRFQLGQVYRVLESAYDQIEDALHQAGFCSSQRVVSQFSAIPGVSETQWESITRRIFDEVRGAAPEGATPLDQQADTPLIECFGEDITPQEWENLIHGEASWYINGPVSQWPKTNKTND